MMYILRLLFRADRASVSALSSDVASIVNAIKGAKK